MLTAVPAGAGTLETPWTDGEGARARLIASSVIGPDGRPLLLAGLQIELDEGWKTYWRTPGDDGGMPPELDWDMSRNLSSVEALYPAPGRFKGIMGYAIGYKHAVVLPFVLDPASTDREVTFHLGVVYGVCKDICVPKEAELAVALKPGETASPEIRRVLEEAYAAVPARGGKGDGLPELVSSRRVEAVGGPALELVARYPAGSEGADLFVEAVDFSYVPVPEKVASEGDTVTYRVDLSKADEPAAEPGARLRVTMVSGTGGREVALKAP